MKKDEEDKTYKVERLGGHTVFEARSPSMGKPQFGAQLIFQSFSGR